MSRLDVPLSHLGLQKYHEPLVSRGFDTWDALVDISEDDMAQLGFELGHRRKLQRAIADYRGQPHNQALLCSSTDSGLHKSENPMNKRKTEPTPSKRRYRRRQPKDLHTPQHPNSGYVLFANFLRQNPLVSKLSFVDISKLVGEQWRCLLPGEKTLWLSLAAEQKSRYYKELAEYQQTEDYKRHQDRLHTNSQRNKRRNGRLDEGTSTATKDHSKDCSINTGARKDIEDATLKQRSKPILGFNDLHGLQTRNGTMEPKSFHIQVLNPFRMISGKRIRPFLDRFLQCVNNCCYCVNAEDLVQQFNLAVDTTVSLTTHTMYTLCLCISIGCQFHDTGTDEMAIMWYENGRRYLDSEDWGWSLYVMRALALISIFHSSERPTTARHYLDTALRIGEANNLSIDIDRAAILNGTPHNDWILVWRTIQMMASIGPAFPTTC